MAEELVLAAVCIALLGVAYVISRKAAGPTVGAQDPPEPFYYPYTTAFDRVCTGDALQDLLGAEGLDIRPASDVGATDPDERRRQFEVHRGEARAKDAASGDLSGTAVCVLVDQSGSMAARMPGVAGALLVALERLEAAGAATMLAGFTTLGWKGNRSRRHWLAESRPAYPGRLCDLLHVVYSDFGHPTKVSDLEPLLDPCIFFENVDGEALLWSEQCLLAQVTARRVLIVVSDGAPVDDSTLSENGPNFLWNHLLMTVSAIRARRDVAIGGIGIDHDVASVYPAARRVVVGAELAEAIGGLASELSQGGAG